MSCLLSLAGCDVNISENRGVIARLSATALDALGPGTITEFRSTDGDSIWSVAAVQREDGLALVVMGDGNASDATGLFG
jgi:hypothetical protein